MRIFKKGVLLLAGACIALALAACDGEFERGGKKVDRAIEKTGDKINEAVK